ncbi:50S ribosomal protein L9 [Neofamilia massiliensis]|uniref:50S ribosomal protein L9 n=1 Tax=Neofamilia massiliensis TaxID=1673724 RepID=UPI0006BB5407|nr:50S ribosomal protein L9 [Neofamilia massiliensis]
MKIILLKDYKNLGKAGEMVDAKDGYARNYLLPRNIAIEATPENVENWKEEQKKLEEEERIAFEGAQELKEKLESITLNLSAKGGETGKLFGSITNAEISKELLKEEKLSIDRKKIELKEPIKTAGLHEVPVRVYPEVLATLKVNIETK